MRTFFALFSYELRNTFFQASSYVTAVLFTVVMGFLYLFILESFSNAAQESLPATEFFKVFWIPVFFIVPIITMKLIADERRLGTLDATRATATHSTLIVLSKFFSAYTFYMLLWASTLLFPLVALYLLPEGGIDPRLVDRPTMMGGYLFIALSGLLYIALGLFSSSLTKSQLIASITTFSLIFLAMTAGPLLGKIPFESVPVLKYLQSPLGYLHTFQQLEDFSRGIVDSRPFFFYISSAALLLGITVFCVETKN